MTSSGNPFELPPGSLPRTAYATFCLGIDQNALQRIMQNFALGAVNGVGIVHLFFQSTGGNVGDGIALYNYFKALTSPELTLYNAGVVSSIAVIAFLGAKRRKASARAVFTLHRSTWNFFQPASARDIKPRLETLSIDDRRTEEIVRSTTTIPAERFAKMDENYDLWLTAQEALEYGVIDEIAEFSPPEGTTIYNI